MQGEADFQRILAIVDPSRVGYVTFDAFLDFITRETSSDVETSEQLLQSFLVLAGNKVRCLPRDCNYCCCYQTTMIALLV